MGKTFVYNTGDSKKIESDSKDITFSVFFDGTQNNKTNTEKTGSATKANPNGTYGNGKRERIQEQGIKSYGQFMEMDNESIPENPTPPSNEPIYQGSDLETVTITSIREKGDSYENDYTNVARLYYAYENVKGDHERIYIEGVGTEDGLPDDMLAVGFGVFATSVRAKARRATKKIFDKLVLLSQGDTIIDTLTIDTFGFSRGATTARYFTHLVTCADSEEEISKYYENHDISKEMKPIWEEVKNIYDKHFYFIKDKSMSWAQKTGRIIIAQKAMVADIALLSLRFAAIIQRAYSEEINLYFKQELEKSGIVVNNVVVRFVGLFDTVSTYGLFADNDVIDLSLNAVNKAYKTVHLSAADEYRKNFALTNINSAGFKGISLSLPGVHCDVGGAYNSVEHEKTAFLVTEISAGSMALAKLGEDTNDFFEWLSEPEEITDFKDKLIDEGWLTKKQFKPIYTWWLNDNVQSLILTGALQWMLTGFPNKTVRDLNNKSLEGLQIGLPPYAVLYGHRKLYNGYTFIPLSFMAEFAIETGVDIKDSYINANYKIPGELSNIHNDLIDYKNEILNLREELHREDLDDKKDESEITGVFDVIEDIFESDKKKKYIKKSKKISYLDFISDEKDLHYLRNNYLHWSAKSDKFGLDPVTRSTKFKDKRKKYDG
ncbi:DUF2235 domain-containing protein [uncultured Flavobacterium sp.]|uniref:phospholipase effector Tle1 domain-containing protein n=1 Tax=uncultured Flavobacterium sp. TaxID=165435 RepID=UPI0025DC436A|nr:DUF2235 domain-containing protein [uncultured Flavobacterium sp.]